MKVGDLVRLTKVFGTGFGRTGAPAVIVSIDDPSGWFWIIDADGCTALWPESQMELLT